MAASTTEMLMNSDGLVVNAYHNAEGRGNYFPGSSGTSEGQFLFIIGNLHAYQATGNPIAKEMAENALKSLLKVVYRNMPVPDVVTQLNIFAPHWLFNVKYPFDSSIIHYDRMANFTNGVGYLTINPDKVRYVYGARSTDSKLLWDNPYSPLTQGTAYPVASSEYVAGQGMKVTLTSNFTGTLYVTHSTQTGPAVLVNEPFEAWPDWRKLDPGEIACAADVFVWAHRAFTLASQVLRNPTWAMAARATREQAAIAFDINDSRDWIKPSWAKSAFAIGSRFQYTTRVPAPGYSVNQSGDVVINVPTYGSGGAAVQYGNASVQDVYGANDVTQIEIGASSPLTVEVFIDPQQAYVEEQRYSAKLALAGGGVESKSLTRADFLSNGVWASTGSETAGSVTNSAAGNYKVAGGSGTSMIGTGTAKNSLGQMVMARILIQRGSYNAQQFDFAVINGSQIGDSSDASGVAGWLANWTTVQLLKADGSVFTSIPLSEFQYGGPVSNGVTRSRLYENSSTLNSQFTEWSGNTSTVKYVRFTNGTTSETIQLYGRPLPAGSPVYTFGVTTDNLQAHTVTLRRVRQTPPRDVMYYPGAIPFTANFQGVPAQLIDWRGPIYMGYQSPAMWAIIGQPGPAATDIQMLSDAQQQWRIQTGQTTLGPFAPVFIFDRPDAVQYGAPNTFTWEGPDPNTRWGGYQYRPLPELTEAAAMLSGAAQTEAIRVAQNFIKWLAQDWAWLPNWAPWVDTFSHMLEHVAALAIPVFSKAHVDEWTRLINKTAAVAVLPADTVPPVLKAATRYARPLFTSPLEFPKPRPAFGPPTDFPKGPAEINYPEPHMAALIMRSVIQLDQILRPNGDASGQMQIEHRAVISKCMAVLDALWIEDGVMGGTFSQNPAGHEWYGFWHGEILDTLALAYTWGRSANVNRISISNQAKIWIDGMLRWSKAAVLPGTGGYQVVPWRYTPNWRSGFTETFEFSTDVFEAFSGKEQRISKRTVPRRRISMRHTLTGNEARGFDALLRARQNLPLLVPQWHLAVQVMEDAPAGQSYILVNDATLASFPWNSVATVSRDGGAASTISVLSTSANRIDLVTPLAASLRIGDKVMPAANGLIDPDTSATRHTGTVLDAQASFIVLPQEDPYELPQVSSLTANRFPITGDTREIIQLRPNWTKEPTVSQAWSFNTSEVFTAGPIVPINGRDQGARTVQAMWTLKSKAEIDSFKALIWRLRGRRYAAWLPSWMDDFVLSRDVTVANRVYVRSSPYLDLGTLDDPAVALHLHLHDGRSTAARVTSTTPISSDEYLLTLDRNIITGSLAEFEMVSLMYRVRQVSDNISINYLTDSVAEVSAAFVSVIDEVE